MLKDRKHDYRLANRNAEFFSDALERALRAEPDYADEDIRFSETYGGVVPVFSDDDRPYFFDLQMRVADGEVSLDLTEAARQLFAQLIAMDNAARVIPTQHDENEELASVILLDDAGIAVLHYHSTLWNSAWDVHFRRNTSGQYELLGIPDSRSPGEFIR